MAEAGPPAPTPIVEEHAPLESQVGGHPGVLLSADGSTIIKPCLIKEIEFYELLQNEPSLAAFRAVCPEFKGTYDERKSIKLENLSQGFVHPNIFDIKLGTVLHDEDATPEKAQRMQKTAESTTTALTGVRLTAYSVYDAQTGQSHRFDKDAGKVLKTHKDLGPAFAGFFPLTGVPTPASNDFKLPEHVGTSKDALLKLLYGIQAQVRAILESFEATALEMVGASVLIIYEGDPDALTDALIPGSDALAYKVKMIDFAHTKVGETSAERHVGVVKGLKTTLELFEERIKDIEA